MKNIFHKLLMMLASSALVLSPVYVLADTATTSRDGKTSQDRITNQQSKGAKEIDQRIDSLNKLATRVQTIRNLTDSQKNSIISTIQAEISSLTTLKNKIASDTSTTTLKEDLKSVTQAYRIYALIMPQINIIAAADRVTTVIGQLNTVGTKLQARIGQDPTASTTSIQSSMNDFSAKLADAQSQVQAAVNEITPLMPDNGDKTKFQSNLAALKDARSKIQAAQKDIVAARKDAQAVVKVLVKNLQSLMDTKHASSTENH